MSFEVHEALARITGEHAAKKQRTVLLLAAAIAAESPQTEVFKRRDTCNRVTWYGRDGEPGWRDDPAIDEALRVAKARALWWMRVRQGGAVQATLDVLVDGAQAAAQQLVRIASEGRVRVMIGEQPEYMTADTGHVVRAANSILDRVSEATADKGAPKDVTIRLTWREAEVGEADGGDGDTGTGD
jgi:hypothetical protein